MAGSMPHARVVDDCSTGRRDPLAGIGVNPFAHSGATGINFRWWHFPQFVRSRHVLGGRVIGTKLINTDIELYAKNWLLRPVIIGENLPMIGVVTVPASFRKLTFQLVGGFQGVDDRLMAEVDLREKP